MRGRLIAVDIQCRLASSSDVPSASSKFILRPLEIKHAFDMAIRLYRSAFGPMLLSTALVQVPAGLLCLPVMFQFLELSDKANQSNLTGATPDWSWLTEREDALIAAVIMLGIAVLYAVIVGPLGRLTCARLAGAALHGEQLSFGEAWAFAVERYWPTQVAMAAFGLPVLLITAVMLIPVAVLSVSQAWDGMAAAGIAASLVIMAAAFVTMLFRYRLFPALDGMVQTAEEPIVWGVYNQGIELLKRAYSLSQGYFLRLFGMIFLLGIATGMIQRGIQESVQLVVMLIKMAATDTKLTDAFQNALTQSDLSVQGISMIVSYLVMLFAPALEICFKTLLYYDLRCRKEGYDLEQLLGGAD